MRKSELAGTGQVFAFTLTQHYKSKATIITLAIFLLFALASVPILSLLSGPTANSTAGIDSAVVPGTDQPTANAEDFAFLKTVYIQNDTDLPVSAAALAALDPTLGEVSWLDAADLSIVAEDASCAGIQITGAAGQYDVTVSAAPDTLLSESVLDTLGAVLRDAVYSAALETAGISGTQLETVFADWSVTTQTQAEWAQEENSYGFDVLYGVNYGYALIMMFLCMMSTSYILSALVEEKASRLVEVLLVSVQPLALIAGKILAVMAWMTMEVLLLIGGFGLSCLLAPLLPGISSFNVLAGNAGFGTFLSSLDWTLAPILLFSLILGYATFSLLGGLFGSGCSSTEDTTGASLGVTMLVPVSYTHLCRSERRGKMH